MTRSNAFRFFAVLPLALVGAAHATTLTWPGAAPCAGTLQACIDGTSNGDRIEIAADLVSEDVSLHDIDRTLAPATGFHPGFGAGHLLSITGSAVSGDRNVAVSGLTLTDGYVFIDYQGTGTATIDVRNMTLRRNASVTANYILAQVESGTLKATIYNNRVVGLPVDQTRGMIEFAARGGTLDGDAYFNHLQSVSDGLVAGAGILSDYAGAGSGGTVRVFGNEVRGSFGLGSIVASGGLNSPDATSYDVRVYSNVVIGTDADNSFGVRYLVSNGTIDTQAVENTVTRVAWGLFAGPYSGAQASSRITGLMSSNLVRAGVGVSIDGAHAPAMTNDYNLVNATSNLAALGTHTITTDARLASEAHPRLSADSPAIDAADTATVGLGLLFNSLPVLDADGLRRLKGTAGAADIGAYEYGDFSFSHTATSANTSGHVTDFDDPSVDGIAAATPIATSNFSNGTSGGVQYEPPFGVYYFNSVWRLFAEDFADMPIGAHFDVFSPAAGSGAFVHTATDSNTFGSVSRIDNSATDSLPDRIVLVNQNWSAGGSAFYNAHHVGLAYLGHWNILNLDGSAMPLPIAFNIYAQEASPNAFLATAAAAGPDLELDHPLLDNAPCARPHVSRIAGSSSADYGFDLDYYDGHWHIYGHAPLAAGTQFNVVVDPAQIDACNDIIFADGFD